MTLSPASRTAPGSYHLLARAVGPAAALVCLVLVGVALSPPDGAGRPAPIIALDPLGSDAGDPLLVVGDEVPGAPTVHAVTGR